MYRFFIDGVEYVIDPIIKEEWDTGIEQDVDDTEIVYSYDVERVVGMKVIRKETDGFEQEIKVEELR